MSNKFKRMVKALPSLYRAETNTMISGLLQAWAMGDDDIEVEIKNTRDQIFVKEAAGKYLDKLASDYGVARSPELGIEDNDFRELVPVLSTFPKQVRQTIISLFDVFWGPGFTRPNINSGNIEPYNLGPVNVITGTAIFTTNSKDVKGNGTQFLSEIQPGDYIKPSGTSSTQYAKVAAVISDDYIILSEGWSSPVSVNTSLDMTQSLTLEYSVDNGRDQRTIRLKPNAFEDITSVTAQEIADFINNDIEHNLNLTGSVFLDPLSGNKLNIRTNTTGLLGSIEILGGTANAPSILNFPAGIEKEVKCNVYEINSNEIVVRIPSSVPVLRRTLKGSIHPKQQKTSIYSAEEPFDFSTLGATSTLEVDVDGNSYTVNFDHAVDFIDSTKVTNEEVRDVINSQLDFLNAFTISSVGNKTVRLETTHGAAEYQITGGTANTILQFTTDLQTDPDIIQESYPSSYVFDPTGQLFSVTGTSSSLSTQINQGTVTQTLNLDDASSFPNRPGKILVNFGRSGQEGPIIYSSRPNNSTLLIDASHIFQNEHLVGRKVNLISDSPTIPRLTGSDYPVYIVGTEESREAAEDLIKKLLASGVVIRFIIEFPEVLFECVCRTCGPDTDPSYSGSRSGLGPLLF
jgi:hypothetical protein